MNNLNHSRATDDAGIKQVLDRHPIIRLAVLFGSLAKGAAGRGSDLDLAIDVDRPLEQVLGSVVKQGVKRGTIWSNTFRKLQNNTCAVAFNKTCKKHLTVDEAKFK